MKWHPPGWLACRACALGCPAQPQPPAEPPSSPPSAPTPAARSGCLLRRTLPPPCRRCGAARKSCSAGACLRGEAAGQRAQRACRPNAALSLLPQRPSPRRPPLLSLQQKQRIRLLPVPEPALLSGQGPRRHVVRAGWCHTAAAAAALHGSTRCISALDSLACIHPCRQVRSGVPSPYHRRAHRVAAPPLPSEARPRARHLPLLGALGCAGLRCAALCCTGHMQLGFLRWRLGGVLLLAPPSVAARWVCCSVPC